MLPCLLRIDVWFTDEPTIAIETELMCAHGRLASVHTIDMKSSHVENNDKYKLSWTPIIRLN